MSAQRGRGRLVTCHRWLAAGAASGVVLLTGCGSAVAQQPHQAGTTAPSAPATAPGHHSRPTVTYVVTGSTADVTWGPAGSNHQGAVPLHVTRRLGHPQYYAITAQLQGGGSVRCKILVSGKVISKARASGSYNIAQCEISRNPLTGRWADTNTG